MCLQHTDGAPQKIWQKGKLKLNFEGLLFHDKDFGIYPGDGVIAREQQLPHYQMMVEKELWWQEEDELCGEGVGDQNWILVDDLRCYYISLGKR